MTHAADGRPVVVLNPKSGSGLEPDELRRAFPDADVKEVPGPELATTAAAAVDGRAPYVAVAGGDGTVRSVAAALMGTPTALLPVPGGTLNHFARAFGIDALDAAETAARTGTAHRVDVGDVNGHIFLNTASLGAYPRMVERRERHEERLPRWIAQPLATLQEVRHGRALRVEIDGRPRRVWLVFVGNGRYGGELSQLGERESLSDNMLDVRVVTAHGRWPRTRLALAALVGRLRQSAVLETWTCTDVTVDVVGGGSTRVALDGDVEMVDSPLHFRSRAGALLVRYNQPS